MKKILLILLSVFHIHSAIVESLIISRPIPSPYLGAYCQNIPRLEEIQRQEREIYNRKLEEYSKAVEAFWQGMNKAAEDWWTEMPDWEGCFSIAGGSHDIYHDKNGIRIISNLVQSFDQSSVDDEISQYATPCEEIYLTEWQGITLNYPLRLKRHSSRDDFVIELIRSGLYKGTKHEQEMYENSGNWLGHHTVVDLFFDTRTTVSVECRSIEHEEKIGIVLLDELGTRIMQPLNAVGLSLPDGRKLHLHYRMSYYEFMMRLIETRHVSFMEYPPHTIQGRSRTNKTGNIVNYNECYYYGPLAREDDPLFQRKQASELRKKQKELEFKQQEEQKAERKREKNERKEMGKNDVNVFVPQKETNAEDGLREEVVSLMPAIHSPLQRINWGIQLLRRLPLFSSHLSPH